jgi:phosphopantothenoylcysteine decarboxylase / phosphopantothenate---cysteine ligase
VVVTAGPTYEDIDPVRFIGNRSSGKMGFALAEVATQRGAKVTLIAGPVSLETPQGVTRFDVRSAAEMFRAVKEHAAHAAVVVMSAAVADFTLDRKMEHKIKKEQIGGDTLSLTMNRTQDILAFLGKEKRDKILVGFALETEHGEESALQKLQRKNADLIVLNNPAVEGAGFETDTNIATIFCADGRVIPAEKMPKRQLADLILDVVHSLLTEGQIAFSVQGQITE